MFDSGGIGRLYFLGGSIAPEQAEGLKRIFQGETGDPNFAVFRRTKWGPYINVANYNKQTTPIGLNFGISPQTVPTTDPSAPVGQVDISATLALNSLTGHQNGYYKIVNAEPTFRLGGQHVPLGTSDVETIDLAGAILADSPSSNTWTDSGLDPSNPLEINGFGEIREFTWAGGDHLPFGFTFLVRPIPVLIPLQGPFPFPIPIQRDPIPRDGQLKEPVHQR